MGLEDAVESAWREKFAQVAQAAVDQPALVAAFDHCAARATLPSPVDACLRTGHALTAIDRNLSCITGTQ
jgi:hypothetical protein